MSIENNCDNEINSSSEILVRISEILKLSISDFFDQQFHSIKDNCEILELLSKIRDVQDRMKVMAFIRTIADRYPD